MATRHPHRLARHVTAWIAACSLTTPLAAVSLAQPASAVRPPSAAPPIDPPTVPPLPDVIDSTGLAADQLATWLAVTTKPGAGTPDEVDRAWRQAYAAALIPILPDLRAASIADDPVGPPWWAVWMVSGTDTGMSLADAFKPIVDGATPGNQADAARAATAFLADLATARAAGDQLATFVAGFLDHRSRHLAATSLFDPTVDPQAVVVDLPTAMFVQWVVVRAITAAVVTRENAVAPAGWQRRAPQIRGMFQGNDADLPCSQFWGSEDLTVVTNQVISKVLGGGAVEGVKLPGLVETIVDLNQEVIAKVPFERAVAFLTKANAVTYLASLLMQLATVTVGGSFDTVRRTKSTSEDGAEITNRLDLSIDPGKLPDGNVKALCALSNLANAAGVQLSFPPAGPLTGVSVTLTDATNMPERATLWSGRTFTTDSTGSVTFKVIGKRQKKPVGQAAAEDYLEYGVQIQAQVEEVTGNSVFNTFWDSLTAESAGAVGFVAPAIDIAKTIEWDLGEHFGPLIDWRPPSFRITGSQGEETFDQVVCDVSVPFELQGSVMTMQFAPAAPGGTGGTVTVHGATGGATFSATGTYSFEMPNGFAEDGTLRVNLQQTVQAGRQASGNLSISLAMSALTDC